MVSPCSSRRNGRTAAWQPVDSDIAGENDRVRPASAAGKRLRQPFDILDGDCQRGVPCAPEWRRYLLAEVDAHADVGVRSEREAIVFQ